ncbi:MAG: glycosyltransferase family 2 protein [Magnetococcales bacterium]|nr:glycosyltransferase family 2 protein [Magnetococcales bacterium]
MSDQFSSVAMCTYNGAAFLAQQLESIARQSLLPGELVVCDDGSRDGTREILREFQKNAPFPVRITCNETNMGTVRNFEQAISQCRGKIVFLSDQDDLWHPDKVRLFMELFHADPDVTMIMTDAEVIDGHGRSRGHTIWQSVQLTPKKQEMFRRGRSLNVLVRSQLVFGSTMAFRKTSMDSSLYPFPAGFFHDEWIALLHAGLGQIAILESPLTFYRVHEKNQSGLPGNHIVLCVSSLFQAVRTDYIQNTITRCQTLLDRLATVSGLEERRKSAMAVVSDRLGYLHRCHNAVLSRPFWMLWGMVVRGWQKLVNFKKNE